VSVKSLPHDGRYIVYCEAVAMPGIYGRDENVIGRMKL
jgi:hypothetical protein